MREFTESGSMESGGEIKHEAFLFFPLVIEVISNGKVKNSRHRVVTNDRISWISSVTFISPPLESIIEPGKGAFEPQLFKSFRYKEYHDIYMANLREAKRTTAVEAYKL